MIVSLVAAAAENGVIGKNGALPWRMPADMKFFKNLTMGHTVIMGRKTYESMGKPLVGRKNVIITRNKDFKAEGCIVINSFEEVFKMFSKEKEIFVIGGAEIYDMALPKTDKIYLTRIHASFDGDAYFHELSDNEWLKIKCIDNPADEKNPYSYTFIELIKKL
jgi:dihydrofolate reductase